MVKTSERRIVITLMATLTLLFTGCGGTSAVQNPPTESGDPISITSQPEIDEMMQLAAGAFADRVNDGLFHLDGELGSKDHTLLIMALKSEARRSRFLWRFVALINDEQLTQASSLIESYDIIYQDLCDRRARILGTEHDGDRVRQLLKYNKVAVILAGEEIRRRLIREVLNPEQRKLYAAQFPPKSTSRIDDNKSK